MTKVGYALEKGGPKRLIVSWKGSFNETLIQLDGNEIGRIETIEQLREGKEFILEDGTSLKVQLERKKILPFLVVLRNGQPLTVPGMEPEKRLRMAYMITFLIASANILFGLMGSFMNARFLNVYTGGMWSFVIGCIFLVLAIFIMRKSAAALSIAVGLILLDLLGVFIFRPNIHIALLIAVVIFRIMVLFVLLLGFGAIKALRQNQAKGQREK